MGLAEFNDRSFSEVMPLENEKQKEAFDKVAALAKKLHVGDMDELQRFKDIREAQTRIEEKLDRIIKHFNIVQIIG